MSAVIRIRLNREHSESLDLSALTPRARALAEALHDNALHADGIVVAGVELLFESELTNAELAQQPPVRPAAYGPPTDPDKRAQRIVMWQLPTVNREVQPSLVERLEREALKIPRDWYPIGVRGRPRVPSWEAAADDYHLDRDGVLAYMREHGQDMGDKAWDTLRGTGHLPEPDRHVWGRPQWRPATIDAYLSRDRELWPISQVAAYLGITTASARKQMIRWGFTAEGRAPGRGGESLYAADQVQAAHHHRPKRGRPRKTGPVDAPL